MKIEIIKEKTKPFKPFSIILQVEDETDLRILHDVVAQNKFNRTPVRDFADMLWEAIKDEFHEHFNFKNLDAFH